MSTNTETANPIIGPDDALDVTSTLVSGTDEIVDKANGSIVAGSVLPVDASPADATESDLSVNAAEGALPVNALQECACSGPTEDDKEDEVYIVSPPGYCKRKTPVQDETNEPRSLRKSARIRENSKKTAKSPSPEYIYISSDSEAEPPAAVQVARQFIDCVVPPQLPPYAKKRAGDGINPAGNVASSSYNRTQSTTTVPTRTTPTTPVGQQTVQNPDWLNMALAEVLKSFPGVRTEVTHCTSLGGLVWGVRCLECKDPKVILVGPGSSLFNFIHHLRSRIHFNTMDAKQPKATTRKYHRRKRNMSGALPPVSASSSSYAPPSMSQGGTSQEVRHLPTVKGSVEWRRRVAAAKPQDTVERFLGDIGLGVELAGALRNVGISDETRMVALGRLSDVYLDRLEAGLLEEGLDISACLLVREGLKQRANAA